MKKRMLEKERENSKKLELVKKLNDSSEEKTAQIQYNVIKVDVY